MSKLKKDKADKPQNKDVKKSYETKTKKGSKNLLAAIWFHARIKYNGCSACLENANRKIYGKSCIVFYKAEMTVKYVSVIQDMHDDRMKTVKCAVGLRNGLL